MKKGREPRLPAEFSRVEVLEAEAQAEFHGSRRVALAGQCAETVGASTRIEEVARTRVLEHYMVEQVHGHHLEIEIEALGDFDVLPKAKVHTPVRQTTKDAPAAIPGVHTKNRLPDGVVRRI